MVTPSLYALYDPPSAPPEVRGPVDDAIAAGGGRLLVTGIDPGWGNDLLPVLMSGLMSEISSIRCLELFDYSTYDQEESVRYLVGMGQPMTDTPPMVAEGVPTLVWGGQLRLMARALGLTLDSIVERVQRRPLDHTVETQLGTFEAGTQGALRFEVVGVADGHDRLVIEHVTRISPHVAPDWPAPADGGAGAHVLQLRGFPDLDVTITATDAAGNRAAGGNATAAGRLVGAIEWLYSAAPGIYDGLSVPLSPGHRRWT